MTPSTPTVPTRPSTPAIDAYYATNHGAQNPRYTFDNGKPTDNGLNTLRGDAKQGLFDQSSVPQSEIDAAQQYLDDMDAWAKANGGFYPGDTNDKSGVGDPAAPVIVDTSADAPAAPPQLRATAATGAPVEIPDHVAESFPDGSTVVQKDGGYLVASVPDTTTAEHEGKFHHIVGVIGEDIEALARRVEQFVARLL